MKLIVNPNEDISIPLWINADYFKDILSKDEPNFVEVKNFTPHAALAPGENFSSVTLRIHMDLVLQDETIKHKTYILKTMLDDAKGGIVADQLNLFPKEKEMYNKYLPAFEELYSSVGWSIQFAPKCLFSECRKGSIIFVFEDLSEKNFKNIDRLQGLDMTHMKWVLRRLAEFHAASAIYQERNGDYPKEFQTGFIDSEVALEYQRNLFETKERPFKTAMQLWGVEDVEKYLKGFPNYEQYWKCCLSFLQQKNQQFNVLNHGDFWSSNIMFSYLSSGEIEKLIFLDFQVCKWGSPAEDLLFLITISSARDIKVKEFDHFVAIYHERLVECLKVLGFQQPLPKLRDLQKDMFDQNNSFAAFFACYNHLVAIMLPTNKDASVESFNRPDEIGEKFRMKAFTNPHYVAAIKDIYPFYHRKGLFNFNDYDDD